MKIVNNTPNQIGNYGAIQTCSIQTLPEHMAFWPEDLETETYYQFKGFVTLQFGTTDIDGVQRPCVVSYQGNQEALDAYLATLPEPAEPEPTEKDDTAAMLVDHEYRLTLLELGLTE